MNINSKNIKDLIEIAQTLLEKLKKYNAHSRVIRRVRRRFHGEKIAIIGPPAAGKTTLLKILQDPSISSEKLKTYNTTELEEFSSFLSDFEVPVGDGRQIRFRCKIQKNADSGGEKNFRDRFWPQVIEKAAVVVYIFDSKQMLELKDKKYKKRILEDFIWIARNSRKLKSSFSIVLAANKVTLLWTTRNDFYQTVEKYKPCLQKFRKEILESWPREYHGNFKGLPFLTLMEDRDISLHHLTASFVWDLLSVDQHQYLKSQGITA